MHSGSACRSVPMRLSAVKHRRGVRRRTHPNRPKNPTKPQLPAPRRSFWGFVVRLPILPKGVGAVFALSRRPLFWVAMITGRVPRCTGGLRRALTLARAPSSLRHDRTRRQMPPPPPPGPRAPLRTPLTPSLPPTPWPSGVDLDVVDFVGRGSIERVGHIQNMEQFIARVRAEGPEPFRPRGLEWKWGHGAQLREGAERGALCCQIALRDLARSPRYAPRGAYSPSLASATAVPRCRGRPCLPRLGAVPEPAPPPPPGPSPGLPFTTRHHRGVGGWGWPTSKIGPNVRPGLWPINDFLWRLRRQFV